MGGVRRVSGDDEDARIFAGQTSTKVQKFCDRLRLPAFHTLG